MKSKTAEFAKKMLNSLSEFISSSEFNKLDDMRKKQYKEHYAKLDDELREFNNLSKIAESWILPNYSNLDDIMKIFSETDYDFSEEISKRDKLSKKEEVVVKTDQKVEKEDIKFSTILRAMEMTYNSKNKDYGNSFDELLDEYGISSAAIRLSDKLNRFKVLTKTDKQNVKDESICDTLLDLANYSIMTILYIKSKQ